MNQIEALTEFLIRFRDERNWAQFHNSKDLAIALAIEAAELNEVFLWKKDSEVEEVERQDRQRIADELADILVYALMCAHRNGFDVEQIIRDKMRKNGEKYPVEKARGRATKYTEL